MLMGSNLCKGRKSLETTYEKPFANPVQYIATSKTYMEFGIL